MRVILGLFIILVSCQTAFCAPKPASKADITKVNAKILSLQAQLNLLKSKVAPGPQGPTGAQGPKGESGFGPIPSGTTVTGVIGGDFEAFAANGNYAAYSSLPGQAPKEITLSDVIIVSNTIIASACGGVPQNCLAAEENSGANAIYCTGNAAQPTAAPGKVCIYPISGANFRDLEGRVPITNDQKSRFGFNIFWSNISTGDTWLEASWAYTAP